MAPNPEDSWRSFLCEGSQSNYETSLRDPSNRSLTTCDIFVITRTVEELYCRALHPDFMKKHWSVPTGICRKRFQAASIDDVMPFDNKLDTLA